MLRNTLFFILLTGLMTGSLAEGKTQDSVVDMSALIDVSGLIEKVSDKRVVYVGETHDQYQHHLNQLAIIKGLHAKHPDLAIGLEFFFQPYQNVLDQYIAGEIGFAVQTISIAGASTIGSTVRFSVLPESMEFP
ncbi:MAG: ChaN family lipoprotein [Candidatus Thiodiazotropha taylori]|nr:ChaN family lipoprotein [Candidatus Thiodiazotropha taylori]